MKKRWMAFALVFGAGLWALSAQQAQQVQRPPVQKQIERPEIATTPIGSITITNPKSTSMPWFTGGGENRIQWSKKGGQPASVKIELRDAACTGTILTIAENTPNDGGHPWAIPSSFRPGTFTIRISGAGATGCSEPFQIVAVPYKIMVGPTKFLPNSQNKLTINWTSTQPSSAKVSLSLVRIEPLSDIEPFEPEIMLASNTPNDGSESFTIDMAQTGSFEILLRGEFGPHGLVAVRGGGPIVVFVPASFSVTLPPDPWIVGSSKTITWTTTQPSDVLLTLTLKKSSSNPIALKFDTLNDGEEVVTVPDVPGTYEFCIRQMTGAYAGIDFFTKKFVKIVK